MKNHWSADQARSLKEIDRRFRGNNGLISWKKAYVFNPLWRWALSDPNPFNPSTVIRFALPKKADVTLMVYNTLGQRVALLVNQHQEAGYHEVVFKNPDLASGVYLYRLQANDFGETKKLLLLK